MGKDKMEQTTFGLIHPYKVARGPAPKDMLYHSTSLSNAEYTAAERNATVWLNGQQVSDAAECLKTWRRIRDRMRIRIPGTV